MIGQGHRLLALVLVVTCSKSGSARDVRLVGGQSPTEGRVEVFLGGQWGTVCKNNWGSVNSQVVCCQLGYIQYTTYWHRAHFGQGIGPKLMDNVSCTGQENKLQDCPYDSNTSQCQHSEDVGLRCSSVRLVTETPSPYINTGGAREGDVRLVNGSSGREGRVEIFHSGQWNTICDDYFDLSEAKVVCREVGYPSSIVAYHGQAFYGEGNVLILMDNAYCHRDELRLTSCYSRFGNHDCTHVEDVGVSCGGFEEGEVRLVGSADVGARRVEIYHRDQWGTICGVTFDILDAEVVCRQLGYSRGPYMFRPASFGQGTGVVWLDQISCWGYESRLLSCSHGAFGNNSCTHAEDVSISCEQTMSGEIVPLVSTISVSAVGVFVVSTVAVAVCVRCCCRQCRRSRSVTVPRVIYHGGPQTEIHIVPKNGLTSEHFPSRVVSPPVV